MYVGKGIHTNYTASLLFLVCAEHITEMLFRPAGFKMLSSTVSLESPQCCLSNGKLLL